MGSIICYFPIGTLGQVCYLIVSIPDLCTLSYLESNFYSSTITICALMIYVMLTIHFLRANLIWSNSPFYQISSIKDMGIIKCYWFLNYFMCYDDYVL